MKITVLGNCATQTLDRETTAYLVSDGNTNILLDCGPGIYKQFLRTGLSPLDISAVILTHCHADHTAGYPYLLFSISCSRIWATDKNFSKVPLYALQSVYDGVSKTISTQYPTEHLENIYDYVSIPDTAESTFCVGDFSLTFFKVFHTVPTVGVRFTHENKSATFSSDTVYNESIANHAMDTDILFHEAFNTEIRRQVAKSSGHTTAIEAGQIASLAHAKKLALCHPLAMELANPGELISEARSTYSGEIILPNDLDVITV